MDLIDKNSSPKKFPDHKKRLTKGCTSLMYSCQQGKTNDVVTELRIKPKSVYIRDRNNKSALHYCCGQLDIVAAATVTAAAPELLESADDDGFTPLHLAVIQGNMPLVNLLIANKANVDAVDNEGHSVVHWATVCGEIEALRAILTAGADISKTDLNGGSPLHYAAQMSSGSGFQSHSQSVALEILDIFLQHPNVQVDVCDKDGRQPLLWAASAGAVKAILMLVKAGARIESADKDGLTALHCAASRGHTECISVLINFCGAPTDLIDTNGCTALHYAVTLGHADATYVLLDLGADPNRQDRKGRTPAHCGCAKGQFETVKLLRDRRANLWLRNAKGDLPLHEAAASGRRELVLWLLDQRPKHVNTTSNDGRTILHIAASNDYIDMCKMLIDFGADINSIYRSSGNVVQTPLDCAMSKGFRSTAKYLQLHGGLPANKLRLSGRKPNALNDQELVTPLSFGADITKRMPDQNELKKNRSVVLYVNRTDSETNDSENRGGQNEMKAGKDGESNRKNSRRSCDCHHHHHQHHHYRHRCRRRTSSCERVEIHHRDSDPDPDSGGAGNNISRSKSNVEIFFIRRKRSNGRRDPSTSTDESCENVCTECDGNSNNSRCRHNHRRKRKNKMSSNRKNLTSSQKQKNVTETTQKYANVDRQKKKIEKGKSKEKKYTNTIDGEKETKKSSSLDQNEPATLQETLPMIDPQQNAEPSDNAESTNTSPRSTSVQNQEKVDSLTFVAQSTATAEQIPDKSIVTVADVHIPAVVEVETALKTAETIVTEIKSSPPSPRPAEDRQQSNETTTNIIDESKQEVESGKQTVEHVLTETGGQSIATIATVESSSAIESNENKDNTQMDSEKGESVEPSKEENAINATQTDNKMGDERNDEKVTEQSQANDNKANESKENENEKSESKETEEIASKSFQVLPNDDKMKSSAEPIDKTNQAINENQENKEENKESNEGGLQPPSEPVEQVRKTSFTVLKSDESLEDILAVAGIDQNENQSQTKRASLPRPKSFKVLNATDAHGEDILLQPSSDQEKSDDDDDISFRKGNRSGKYSDSELIKADGSFNGRRKKYKKRAKSSMRRLTVGNASISNPNILKQQSRDQDSGIEPSPRVMRPKQTVKGIYTAPLPERPRVGDVIDSRACSSRFEHRKPGDKHAVNMSTVSQSIQRNIRRYYMEHKIFQHLLELKSLQIRSSKVNESLLVKRAVDDYHKSTMEMGSDTGVPIRRYPYKEYTFKNFEIFLYEVLKSLQKNGSNNYQNISDVYLEAERRLSPDYSRCKRAMYCTSKTHRCLHATHAYTGIPCAAYIPMMNHHTIPKLGFGKTNTGSFYLPKICTKTNNNNNTDKYGGSGNSTVSLELSHGNNKQLITLPAEKLDNNKRYYVTFTLKESERAGALAPSPTATTAQTSNQPEMTAGNDKKSNEP